jgi:hypothetical protein
LVFSNAQLVAFVDCCCGSFCTHKNACGGCDTEKECRNHGHSATARMGVKRSCCRSDAALEPQRAKEEGKKRVCAHLEPSQEVATQSPEAISSSPSWETVAVVDPGLGPSAGISSPRGDLAQVVPRSPPDVPLHLFLSVLTI